MLGVCLAIIDDEGDKNAFEKLYKKYRQKCYALAYKILGNESLAEDACSETFLRIAESFQKIHSLETHKMDYYIVITIRNVSYNILKKENKHNQNVEFDEELVSLSDAVLNQYSYDKVVKCIKKLSEIDKEILYMRVYLELSFKDISASLGISSNAAQKRMEHSKKCLKTLLNEEGVFINE